MELEDNGKLPFLESGWSGLDAFWNAFFSYIRKLKPKLNKQSDPIRAKLFAQLFHFFRYCFYRLRAIFIIHAAIFLYCFYKNIKFNLIIDCIYLSAYKNFAFQIENDRRTVETSLSFNVSDY